MESDLSQPVSDWMKAQGFTPYAEVSLPWRANAVDLIGRRGDELVAVELKRSLTSYVMHQAYRCNSFTPLCYAAVGTKPKAAGLERCRKLGIGLLCVAEGRADVAVEPDYPFDAPNEGYVRRVHAMLDRMTPGGLGGVPCMKGTGPAQECYERVRAYRADNPRARWREVFEAVPNHYLDYKSLCGAMRIVEIRRREG
jgi:hypothetical protein